MCTRALFYVVRYTVESRRGRLWGRPPDERGRTCLCLLQGSASPAWSCRKPITTSSVFYSPFTTTSANTKMAAKKEAAKRKGSQRSKKDKRDNDVMNVRLCEPKEKYGRVTLD